MVTTNIEVPRRIDISEAEKLLATLARLDFSGKEVIVDFRGCDYVGLGAGYRVGNSLRRVAEKNKLKVLVTDQDFSQHPSSEWFLNFTRSGLGPAIAARASVVLAGEKNISEELNAYYQKALEVPSQNAVYFPDIHLGRLDVEDESRFGRVLLAQFRFLNVSPSAFNERALTTLAGMCFEAAQNTVDHAAKKPLPSVTRIISYLSLRYYKFFDRPDEGAFSSYRRRIAEQFASDKDLRFIEIVVNDDGVGMAARESQSLDIYFGPAVREEEALQRALTNSRVKLVAQDSQIRGGVAGQGYRRIREGIKQLRAFASLRTGRLFATLDGTSAVQTDFRLMPSSHGLPFAPEVLLTNKRLRSVIVKCR